MRVQVIGASLTRLVAAKDGQPRRRLAREAVDFAVRQVSQLSPLVNFLATLFVAENCEDVGAMRYAFTEPTFFYQCFALCSAMGENGLPGNLRVYKCTRAKPEFVYLERLQACYREHMRPAMEGRGGQPLQLCADGLTIPINYEIVAMQTALKNYYNYDLLRRRALKVLARQVEQTQSCAWLPAKTVHALARLMFDTLFSADKAVVPCAVERLLAAMGLEGASENSGAIVRELAPVLREHLAALGAGALAKCEVDARPWVYVRYYRYLQAYYCAQSRAASEAYERERLDPDAKPARRRRRVRWSAFQLVPQVQLRARHVRLDGQGLAGLMTMVGKNRDFRAHLASTFRPEDPVHQLRLDEFDRRPAEEKKALVNWVTAPERTLALMHDFFPGLAGFLKGKSAGGRRRFDGALTTDGVSCRLQMVKGPPPELGPGEAMTKRKRNRAMAEEAEASKERDALSHRLGEAAYAEFASRPDRQVVVVDPGHKAVVTAGVYVSGELVDTYACSNAHYYQQCGFTAQRQALQRLSARWEQAHPECVAVLRGHVRLTERVAEYAAYVHATVSRWRELWAEKLRKRYRQLRFQTTRRFESGRHKLLQELTRDRPADTCLAWGDSSFGPTTPAGGHAAAPNRGLLAAFRRKTGAACLVDEFRTSKLSACCQAPNLWARAPGGHRDLRTAHCPACKRTSNRDANAVLNLYAKFQTAHAQPASLPTKRARTAN